MRLLQNETIPEALFEKLRKTTVIEADILSITDISPMRYRQRISCGFFRGKLSKFRS